MPEAQRTMKRSDAWGIYDGTLVVSAFVNEHVARERLEDFTRSYRPATLVPLYTRPTEGDGARAAGKHVDHAEVCLLGPNPDIDEALRAVHRIRAALASQAPAQERREGTSKLSATQGERCGSCGSAIKKMGGHGPQCGVCGHGWIPDVQA